MERRKYLRSDLKINITFRTSGAQSGKGTSSNISQRGMFIETNSDIQEGEQLTATLDAADIGKVLTIQGKVLRRSYNGVAIRFSEDETTQILIDAILKNRSEEQA